MKAKKTISPIVGMFGTLETLKDSALNAGVGSWRADALSTTLPTYEVDTCVPLDTRTWETGIKPNDKGWVIVEQYEDETEARKGHARWVSKLTTNPKLRLRGIHIWEGV